MKMAISQALKALQAAASLSGLTPTPRIPLTEQIEGLTLGYRRLIQGLPERMAAGLREEVRLLGSEPRDPRLVELYRVVARGEDLLAGHPKAFDIYSLMFAQIFVEQSLPGVDGVQVVHGYMQGEDIKGNLADIDLLIHGVPSLNGPTEGIIVYLDGYGGTFPRSADMVVAFALAGQFVLYKDHMDAGGSSRWDPTVKKLKGAELNVRHDKQLVDLAIRLTKQEGPFKDLPVYVYGVSMGGGDALAMFRLFAMSQGVEAVFLHSPRLELQDPKYTKLKPWQPRVFKHPWLWMNFPPTRKGVFIKKPPEPRDNMTAEQNKRAVRLHNAQALLTTNMFPYHDHPLMDAASIEWLKTKGAGRVIPRVGLGFDIHDPDVKPETNLRAIGSLMRENTFYRQVVGHLPTPNDPGDPTYVPDVVAFVKGEQAPTQDSFLHAYGKRGYEEAMALFG